MSESLPAEAEIKVKEAVPDALSGAEPIGLPLLRKVMEPVGDDDEVIVAVRVTVLCTGI